MTETVHLPRPTNPQRLELLLQLEASNARLARHKWWMRAGIAASSAVVAAALTARAFAATGLDVRVADACTVLCLLMSGAAVVWLDMAVEVWRERYTVTVHKMFLTMEFCDHLQAAMNGRVAVMVEKLGKGWMMQDGTFVPDETADVPGAPDSPPAGKLH